MDLNNITEDTTNISPEMLEKAGEDENKYFDSIEDRFKKDTTLRIQLAKYFSIVIALWLLAVVLILVGNNFKYRLSDTVLVTLLTTTTIQILGMMIIILWDLFPGGKESHNHTEKIVNTKK